MNLSEPIKKFCFLFFLFLSLTSLRCGKGPKEVPQKPAFDFSLPDLNGKIWSMNDCQGQVVVLSFWATWCPPCVEEVPKLSNLYLKYRSQGVQVIGIALDKNNLDLLGQFVRGHGISYPVLVGTEQILANLHATPAGKNLKGVPATFIFDQRGQVYKRFDGSFDPEQMEESLQTLLAAQKTKTK
ncbi:MAG: TlpA disulfide reductase family protein [Candidatus Zixiibacteriota bacterium]